jgi:hypothetical protein
MVSVLVSVSDPETPKSVLQTQLRLEARAGIGPGRQFSLPRNSSSRRSVTGLPEVTRPMVTGVIEI